MSELTSVVLDRPTVEVGPSEAWHRVYAVMSAQTADAASHLRAAKPWLYPETLSAESWLAIVELLDDEPWIAQPSTEVATDYQPESLWSAFWTVGYFLDTAPQRRYAIVAKGTGHQNASGEHRYTITGHGQVYKSPDTTVL